MTFVQVEFVAFFAIVYALYWVVRSHRWQNVLLVAASAVFYGWVHPWFLLLLYGSAVMDFAVGLAIGRWRAATRPLVALSITANLSMLGYFKYADFFVDNVVAALHALGIDAEARTLGVLLPVGISFYTFQTMSYVIDVARGELEPRASFVDTVLYVSFFPQLMAGPIERAGHLLPQIEQPRRFSWAALRSGIALVAWGGFKKLAIADSIAPYVDKVFVLDAPSGPLVWAATAGFMVQLFADFSGYTDIARGTARMLGFDLVPNFREPFLARTTIAFWQRWHMSLSSWLRDYVLGPLVGDRGATRVRFAVATIVTFLLVGLWHGPSWNFVLFGLYHGSWVVLYGVLLRVQPAWTTRIPGGAALAVAFHLVAVGLVGSLLFRETHVDRIVQHLTQNPFAAPRIEWIAVAVLFGVTATGAAILVLQWALTKWVAPRFERRVWWLPVQTTVWAALAVAMFLFYRTTLQDFVYFQF